MHDSDKTIASQMFLTLIETSSNQSFIFSTNKLRENIGASELTYRSCTQWVLAAIANEVQGMTLTGLWSPDGTQLRRNLLDPRRNPAIEGSSSTGLEIIVAASGKAMFLSHSRDVAQNIIRRVTRRALTEAPGLNIFGYIHPFNWNKDCLGDAVQTIHTHLEVYRTQRIAPNQRFQRIPVVQSCTVSGQPVTHFSKIYKDQNDKRKPVSAGSHAKAEALNNAKERLQSLLHHESDDELDTEFAGTTSELDQICDWLAIVHADGNGLGKIFQQFHKHINATDPKNNRTYIDKLRRFSIALDQCTQEAFAQALRVLPRQRHPEPTTSLKSKIIPLAPLVLGGDDLTVVCDGRYALQFTHAFLSAFEVETASAKHFDGIIPEIAKTALKADRLSACAGVSIIKPHFPFSVGYGIAESLIRSSKTVKQTVKFKDSDTPYPCSAIDFNILYDSSVVDLEDIRHQLICKKDGSCLHNRPYVVTQLDHLIPATVNGQKWSEFHHWEHLCKRIDALKAKTDEGDRQLPSSQMHDLRSSLFLGKQASDGLFQLIQKRYSKAIQPLIEKDDSLFTRDLYGASQPPITCTRFLDALDSLEFFEKA